LCGEKDLEAVLKGDIDGDGKVNAVDLFKMKLFVKQMFNATEKEAAAADVNSDGKINALDLFELKFECLQLNREQLKKTTPNRELFFNTIFYSFSEIRSIIALAFIDQSFSRASLSRSAM
jgi:hypothetical protein